MLPLSVSLFIVLAGLFGIAFSLFQYKAVANVKLPGEGDSMKRNLIANADEADQKEETQESRMVEIYEAIRLGADSFLRAEYRICGMFIVGFGTLVLIMTSRVYNHETSKTEWKMETGALTAIAFVMGAVTSMASGWLGMKVAVYANARTTVAAMSSENNWTFAFNTAFRAGSVMGFSLCGLALLNLYMLICLFHIGINDNATKLFECIAGYGLGGSSIAMFGRVGGGIYTKAADVGADLAGKVIRGIPEDDPRNPACIADNVGDNVGDVAGMGSDLFGSFAEASCAALVVISQLRFKDNLNEAAPWKTLMFPLFIHALGIFVCFACSFIATHISPVRAEEDVEKVLKVQLISTSVLLTATLYPIAKWSFPSEFFLPVAGSTTYVSGNAMWVCLCVWAGLWCGCIIGFITEYYTSHSYNPTREVAQSCETGAATNIIYGLALGYKSAIVPICLLSFVVWFSFSCLDMLGVSLAALGMLSNLATCLSIDVFGPVCDNAGGIAEMSKCPKQVREVTDALDAAGNTTAAIGKGFAIGSACLVGLALFGAFVTRSGLRIDDVSLLKPTVFAAVILGAMLPYWFSALTMKSVGKAANEMVKEVAKQFNETPGLLEGLPGVKPNHERCIDISTKASLKEMVAPAILVMSSPILCGIFFGSAAVAGLLAGAISSSIQMAISASNTGGAWDNAKKYVEKGEVSVMIEVENGPDVLELQTKEEGSRYHEIHSAAVTGDTVGDPLKDTSGPALNIVMKLMAILSLVFADFFFTINKGNGLIHWHREQTA